MPPEDSHKLDDILRQLLDEAPLTQVSDQMAGRMDGRLRVSLVRGRLIHGFRCTLCLWTVALCLSTASVGGLLWANNAGAPVARSLSGAWGQLDYYETSLRLAWDKAPILYSVFVAGAAAALLAVSLLPGVKRLP